MRAEEEEDDQDALALTFAAAADEVQQRTSSKSLDQGTLLKLYGLYKVATVGSCNEKQPGWLSNPKARAKWAAWREASSLLKAEAMDKYINLVKETLKWKGPSTDSRKKVEGLGNSVSTFAPPTENEDAGDADEHPAISWAKDNDLKKLRDWAQNANKAEINAQDKGGLTCLHWAVDRGHFDACKILLDAGADPNVTDKDGATPLEYAETCEHHEIIGLLNKL